MNDIVKICKKHGELTKEMVSINRKNVLICKKCRNNQTTEWRIKNKENLKLKCLNLRKLAKENKVLKICKIHGKLDGKDILIDIRAKRICGLCRRKKSLERYRKEKKSKPKSSYQILREEKNKGNCLKHGINTRTKKGNKACRFCRQQSSERWRKKHPEKVKEMNEKRRLILNGGKYKENQRKILEIRKSKDPEGYKKLMAKKAKEYRDKLPDAYIKQQIKATRLFKKDGIKIPVSLIPQELVEIKRLHLQLKKRIINKGK